MSDYVDDGTVDDGTVDYGTVEGGTAGQTGQVPAGSGHAGVDAVIRSMANATDLSMADQIAEYEAAYQALRETLATIDQA
jgi:hypothetical protein